MDKLLGLKVRLNLGLVKQDECSLWTGLTLRNGYGQIWFDGKMILVHRASFMVNVGPIPEGKLIRHTCDIRPCCAPKHLIPGTHADNMQDMVDRDRTDKPKGELHPLHKLTEKDVMQIRKVYPTGQFTQQQLGDMYGVHRVSISRIVLRKDWKHI